MERETVRLRMWTSGAYALASTGADGAACIVEHDGRGALHTIDIARTASRKRLSGAACRQAA